MGTKKIILLIGLQVLLMLAAVGGTWYLTQATVATSLSPDEAKAGEAMEPAPKKDPIVVPLEPAFVINLQDGRTVRFLQLQIEVMTRNEPIVELLDKYRSRIRNDLILMLSSLDRESISTPEGRLKVQEDTLATINNVLMEESGMAGVEAVYFTKFVTQ